MTFSRWAAFLCASLAALAWGAAAGAAPFAGTLGITVGAFGGLGTLAFVGAGSGTSTANGVTVPGGTFMGSAIVSQLMGSPPITGIAVKIAGNGAGSFVGNPLAGTLPILGGVGVKGSIGTGHRTLAGVPFFTAHDPGSAAGNNGLGVGGSLMIAIGARAST